MAYFILARACFLIYYSERSNKLTTETLAQIFIQGLKLDLSMSAYLSLLPFALIALSILLSEKLIKRTIRYYTFIVIFIINFLMLFDIGLYEYWGIRLDITPFIYMDTPGEMLASVTAGNLILVTALWVISSLLLVYLFNRLINFKLYLITTDKLWHFITLTIIIFCLPIAMRGGFQNSPINQSDVYFSDVMFANHAAVNFAWNFNHSLNIKEYENENPFVEYSADSANNIFLQAQNPLLNEDSIQYPTLKTTKPNIVLIIWESLTAKVVGPLGGEPDVTQHFNNLCKEGILFTNFYANGDRSDKGLVSILSGYYPQPHKSIIKIPNKTRTLPMLPQKLKNMGYTSSFYYGGSLNFMNMNTYLRSSGIKKYVDINSFSRNERTSKWGVPDDILFKKFGSDIATNIKQPFFNTLFTLSSHNPYDFNGEYKFGKDTEENKFRSSHAFTDRAVYEFVEFAKKQPWWNNTLIVIMADHGNPLPVHEGEFNSPIRFHVPMLWIGGALEEENSINSNFCTQSDFAYTLLALLDGDNSEFEWGKNMFVNSQNHFAHYIFNKGFGTLKKNGHVVYDYVITNSIDSLGIDNAELKKLGKAITQTTFQDFIDRH